MLDDIEIPALPAGIRWAMVALVATVLVWGSLSTGSVQQRVVETFPYGDEALHILAYAGLALSATYAWLPPDPKPLRRGIVVFVLVFAFGLSIEGLQSLVPGRTPDVGDAVADGVGAASALVWDALVARFVALPEDA